MTEPTHLKHPLAAPLKIFFYSIFVLILVFCGGAQKSQAQQSAKGCHCFKNRAFKPDQKFAADDYILATSFNSLIARSFNIAKRDVVMLKMKGGVSQGDLLVGLKTAKVTGEEKDLLLEKRTQGESWQKILSEPKRTVLVKQDKVLNAIQQSTIPEDKAGPLVADSIIAEFFHIPTQVVASYRSTGLSEKEITLILILSARKQKDAQELAALYQQKGKSWSEIAFDLGIMPKAAGLLILNYGR